MTKDLEEYYNNIKYLNKEIAEYKDEEGNYFIVNPASLIVAVQYAALNKQELEQAIFQGLIPKDIILKETEIEKPIPKYEITKKECDKYIITTKKEKVKQVWYLVNGLGIRKAYADKDEALKKANEINKEIFKVSEIEIW